MYITKAANALLSSDIVPLVTKRDDQKCTEDACAELPVSTWQKTGIPVIISLVLFSIVFAVLFYIVRKKRQSAKKQEEEAQAKIDMDDMEERASFRAGKH